MSLVETHLARSGAAAAAAAAAGAAPRQDHVIAIAHDYLKRGNRVRITRFGEAICDIPIDGVVYAVGEVPAEPGPYADVVFAPSGAIVLPNCETAPFP